MQAASPGVVLPRRAVWPRRLIWIGGALIGLGVLAIFGPSIYVVSVLTKPTRTPVDPSLAARIGAHWVDVSFPSRDTDITLKGWLFRPDTPNGRSVITVHGWTHYRIDTSYHTDQVAHDLLLHGYAVLLFDLRASGESGGDRFTLANHEYRDVLGAYDFMKQQGFDPHKLAVVGDSMGAASTLLAAPEMPDVGAIVADSAFADLRPIIEAQLPARMPLPAFYTQPVLWVGPLFGLNADLRPVDRVKALPQRAFLFFHGLADDFIPPSNGEQLRAASANPQSTLVLVPGAKHVRTYEADPAAYMAHVYQFFDQQMGP